MKLIYLISAVLTCTYGFVKLHNNIPLSTKARCALISKYNRALKSVSEELSLKTADSITKNQYERRESDPTIKGTTNRTNIVLITGFENFNIKLYNEAANIVMKSKPNVNVLIFTDTDINDRPNEVDAALGQAAVLFSSLLFDYSQIQWLKRRIEDIPTKFCFESALELMSETRVGEFNMMNSNKENSGPPPAVKAILKQFGSDKEEDKMTGYLKFLKFGPKLLNLIPKNGKIGQKVKDLRTWLTVYAYWNQGGLNNIISMLYFIIEECGIGQSISSPSSRPSLVNKVQETPAYGIFHPKLLEGVNQLSITHYYPYAYYRLIRDGRCIFR
jgi:magnesium chelatase subunit H